MKLKNCNAETFISRLTGRKVICFGAGSTLIEADYEVLKIDNLEEHIAFFVDNDANKHGLQFEYADNKYEIKSVEVLKEINVEDYVLLITCAFYVEIYHQLKDIVEIANLDCYMYNVVCSYPNLDVVNFFEYEVEKIAYKNWQQVLQELKIKNKHYGNRCFIIGNGPSLRIEDLEKLSGEVTFGANRIFKLFPDTNWRPTYYVCIDYLMYGLDHKEISELDVKLRFVPIERALAAGKIYDEVTYYNRVVNCVSIQNGKIVRSKEFEFSDNMEEVVKGGQTVLYDAIQIAVYMGFKEIYLYGVDCDYKYEVLEDGTIVENDIKENHFNKNYDEGLEEAIAVVAPLYAARLAFQKAKEICEEKGIIIKNITRGGKLEVFPRTSIEEVLK